MAYTYNDFLNAANGSGVMDRFSREDLTVAQKNPEYGLSMVSLMKDLAGATTAEQRLLATEAANQLRKNYGVYNAGGGYAGSHGSAIGNLQGQLQNYGSFNYANQGQLQQAQDKVNNFGSFNYANQEQLDNLQGQLQNYGSFNYGNETIYQQLLNAVANQQHFSYDQAKDPSYSALKKTYLREGERAGANALAQAAAASGGQVSSYAAQAAQQANNYYAGQLADIIPTLEQNAYQRYLSDFERKLSGLGAVQSDRAQAQQQWQAGYDLLLNNLANLQNDRSFSYQDYLTQYEQAMNALSNLQNDRAQAQEDWLNGYNILQNNLQNLQQQDATDYQRYLQKAEQAQQKYENALALYNLLGYATPEVADILGLNTGSVAVNTPSQGSPNPGSPNPGPSGEPTIDEETEDEPVVEETTATLSDAAKRFMATLPYAYGGSSQETWNKVVDERLITAYNNGVLSESDVAAIMAQLGLYNITGAEVTNPTKAPATVGVPVRAPAASNKFYTVSY